MMNDLSNLLTSHAIEADLSAPNKKALFHHLSVAAGRGTGIEPRRILTAISERERVGSTGFGGGVAIPHGKIEGLGHVTGYFARLTAPIDFQSVDRMPVDLVFLLLSPPDAGADHLKALASVSRTLRDRQTLAKLRGARSRDAIFALLAGVETLNAA
jgi:PTS system nitrogen regulatory IIA component